MSERERERERERGREGGREGVRVRVRERERAEKGGGDVSTHTLYVASSERNNRIMNMLILKSAEGKKGRYGVS